MRFTLISPLQRNEIVQRLRESVGSRFAIFNKKPMVGSVFGSSFNLRVRIDYRNSFQTVLHGRLIDDGDGTRIECRVGMSLFTAAFMTIWFSFVTLAVLSSGFGKQAAPFAVWPHFVPVIMLIFGVLLVVGGRWFARGEAEQIVAFLEETIDAAPV